MAGKRAWTKRHEKYRDHKEQDEYKLDDKKHSKHWGPATVVLSLVQTGTGKDAKFIPPETGIASLLQERGIWQ